MHNKHLDHYRTSLKIYGHLIMELADCDEEILCLINDENPGDLMSALRDRIEDSQKYE